MLEDQLREIASTEGKHTRERLAKRLIEHEAFSLERVMNILQQNDPLVGHGALLVIQALGFPKNAAAIPLLLKLVGNKQAPLKHEALLTLVSFGSEVLPYLVHQAKEDEDIDLLLTDALAVLLREYVLTEMRAYNKPLIQQIIAELRAVPQAAVPMLIFILNTNLIESWTPATWAVEAIGYPENAEALPSLIEHTMLGNDPIEYQAIQLLEEVGPQAAAPYLIEVLWDDLHGEDDETRKYPYADFRGCCQLLFHRGRSYAVPYGPLLAFLFAQRSQRRQSQAAKDFFRVLELIGTEAGTYALPVLLAFMQSERSQELRQLAAHLINKYDERDRALYQRVIDVLR
jgi:hypothetical protein